MSTTAYTWADVLTSAQKYIDDDHDIIYDVALNIGQIVGNVKHMKWFRHRVALELRDTLSKFEDVEIPETT